MKAVLVHGFLALFGLAFAYQTWTRKPEENPTPGSVTVAECSSPGLGQVKLVSPTIDVTIEPQHGADGTYWIEVQHKSVNSEKDKDKDKPHELPDAQKPRRFLANAAFAEYLKKIEPLRAQRSLGKLPKDKDKEFGFDKVGTYLTLKCEGKTLDLEAGARSYGSSERYLRDLKSHTTYLFEEQLVSDLEAAQYKFMQSELHNFGNDEIEEVEIDAHGAKKRLLHRDRKLPNQALWVDAKAPDKRNELYDNWFSRLGRLRARFYLDKGAEPGSDLKGGGATESVLSMTYKVADKPAGKLELVRVDENGVGHYYARTETTQNWVALYDSTAKEVEQDVGMVVGSEQPVAPAKDAASPKSATAHVSESLPPGHPTLPGGPHAH